MVKPISKLITVFVVIIAIVAVGIVSYLFSRKQDNDTSTLKLLAVLHRHGYRTPTRTYHNDPYKESTWPVPFGQLMKQGKQQLYKAGQTFKKLYESYINKYSSKTVYVRTSDYDRCHMSVAALLAGWFPPADREQTWNDELRWQPISIHSRPIYDDNVIAQEKSCRKYNKERKKILEEIKSNESEEDKQLFSYLAEKMGQSVSTFHDIEVFYTTLTIEKLYGLELPSWTSLVYPDKMKIRAMKSMRTYTQNELLKRLSVGPFLNELINQCMAKSKKTSEDLKLLIYSGHDTTLAGVWYTLGFNDLIFPDFGSSFTFELHNIDGDYFIKMLYLKNSDETEPQILQIPNCPSSGPCPLDVFYNITQTFRPRDWDAECNEV